MRKTAISLSLILGLAGQVGWSACQENEALFFSCSFAGGKEVRVCNTDQYARYDFGVSGRVPELSLSVPIVDVHLTPWPGVGRTIWEEVRFDNEGYSYVVLGAIHRDYPEDENADIIITRSGGINVLKGEDSVATMSCLEDSIEFPWDDRIYAAKIEAGQCYDDREFSWSDCTE